MRLVFTATLSPSFPARGSVSAEVGRVRVPVRWPVAVGVKRICRKQEALGVRVLVQGAPPVGAALRAKSPVVAGGLRVTGAAVELVRVKRVVGLVLLTGIGPKSRLTGVRMRPVRGRPISSETAHKAAPNADPAPSRDLGNGSP